MREIISLLHQLNNFWVMLYQESSRDKQQVGIYFKKNRILNTLLLNHVGDYSLTT